MNCDSAKNIGVLQAAWISPKSPMFLIGHAMVTIELFSKGISNMRVLMACVASAFCCAGCVSDRESVARKGSIGRTPIVIVQEEASTRADQSTLIMCEAAALNSTGETIRLNSAEAEQFHEGAAVLMARRPTSFAVPDSTMVRLSVVQGEEVYTVLCSPQLLEHVMQLRSDLKPDEKAKICALVTLLTDVQHRLDVGAAGSRK